MTNFDRRPRGRNNNRRNGRRSNGHRGSQVIKLNDQGRSFNQQRVKFNGNASKLFEKYTKLATEALATGDKILAEHYYQHADHFARMLPPPEELKNNTEAPKDEEQQNTDEENIEERTLEENTTESTDSNTNTVVAKSSE
jgi:hypothetical protein